MTHRRSEGLEDEMKVKKEIPRSKGVGGPGRQEGRVGRGNF